MGGVSLLRYKSYKYRIYPNGYQERLIIKTFGCCRYIFNHFLKVYYQNYHNTSTKINCQGFSAQLPIMKRNDETSWLKEIDSIALQSALSNLNDSLQRFYRGQNSQPKFKTKSSSVQSYTTKNVNGNIKLSMKSLLLPKVGHIKYSNSRSTRGRILSATISMHVSGKFFVSILCEEDIQILPKANSSVGVDFGIRDFITLSTGEKIRNPYYLMQMEGKLKIEQRKLRRRAKSAKERGVSLSEAMNYQKQRRKVARIYEKIANQREDFLNKLSTIIIKSHDNICVEDIDLKSLMSNRNISQKVFDASWGKFIKKLEYKASWYGRKIIKINRWYASSQHCSSCGKKFGKLNLDIRVWECKNCHAVHDRDINASINILNYGLSKNV